MVATVGSISIDLSTNVAKFASGFRTAATTVDRESGRMGRAVQGVERRNRALAASFASFGSSIKATFGVLATGLVTREFKQLADAATQIDNALKVAGLSGDDLEQVYGRLRDSAVANAAPLKTLVQLYSRAALVQNELKVTTEDLLQFTDKVALALRVAGTDAGAASGALLQLSQALGSGVVRAEEFNSILEGAPTILQAAAAGIEEAEGSVSKLRKIMLDGNLSSRALFNGFIVGSKVLEERVASSVFTVDQAFTNLGTALLDVAREFNNSTGASERFANAVNSLAQVLSDFDVTGFIEKIRDTSGVVSQFMASLANAGIIERFAEAVTGLDLTVGKPIDLGAVEAQKELDNLERKIGILEDRIEANKEMAIDTTEAEANLNALLRQARALRDILAGGRGFVPGTPGDPNALAQMAGGRSGSAPKATDPISLKDFPVEDPNKSGQRIKVKVPGGTVGVTKFGEETADATTRTADTLDNVASRLPSYFDDLGGTFDNSIQSINGLFERGIDVLYGTIADGVRTGIISGMQETERKRYTISTGSPTASIERQIEELRLIQGTTGGLASEGISQKIAELELQRFRMERGGGISYAGAFADGGSFIAPGNQSGDTTRLLMDVNGGERVTVSPAGSGAPITLNFYAAPGESESTMRQRARKAGEEINRQLARA